MSVVRSALKAVPDVLLGGNHAAIAKWRQWRAANKNAPEQQKSK